MDINAPILDIIYFLFHQKKPNLSHYAGNMKNSLGGIEQVVDEDEETYLGPQGLFVSFPPV